MRSGLLGVGPLATALAAALIAPRPADASPLEDPAIGGSTFTGVTAPHATSILINPAALAMSGSGLHLYTQLGGRASMLSVDRKTIDPDTLEEQDGPSVSETVLMPGGLLALYGPVADRGTAAIAIGLPMIERFAQSDEFAYHSGGGHFYQAQLSVAGHLRLGGRFHVGLGVSLAYSSFKLNLARDTAMDAGTAGITSDCNGAPCGFENPAARQELDIEASTQGISGFFSIPDNIGGVLGAMWEIRPEWWRVALSVVAPPGTFTDLPLRGTVKVTDAPRDGAGTRSGIAEVPFRAWESIRLGFRGPLSNELELHGSVRWQNTSRHERLDIRMFGADLEGTATPDWYPRYRGFRDSVRVQAGVERRLGFPLRYGGRIRVESGAVKGSRLTPIQVEGWNVTASGGAQMRVAQHFVLAATYDLTWYPTRTTDPTAFDPRNAVACVDTMFSENACAANLDGRATPTAAGTYSRLEHGLVLSVRYDSL